MGEVRSSTSWGEPGTAVGFTSGGGARPLSPGSSTGSLDSEGGVCTPLPVDVLKPPFQVSLHQYVPDELECTFQVWRVDNPVEGNKAWFVSRSYDDVAAMCVALNSSIDMRGLIMPPLPSAKHFLALNPVLQSRVLHRYLQLVCEHPVLGRSKILERFWDDGEARRRVQGYNYSMSEPRSLDHKDIDEYFSKTKEWVISQGGILKNLEDAAADYVNAHQKYSAQCGHLSTALLAAGNVSPDRNVTALHLHLRQAFLQFKENQEGLLVEQRRWLHGSVLENWLHLQNAHHMLNKRLLLLIEYENANKVLARAKPHRRDAAERTRSLAERSLEDATDAAREELKRFTVTLRQTWAESLTNWAEAELQAAKNRKYELSQIVATLHESSDLKSRT